MGLLEKIFPPLSRESFGKRILGEMVRRDPSLAATARFDAASFSITGGKDNNTAFLTNAYREYCALPFLKRKTAIEFYSKLNSQPMPAIAEEFTAAKPNLLPRIRDRAYLVFTPLRVNLDLKPGQKEFPAPAHRLLNEWLGVEIIYDGPQTISSVSTDQLSDWKTTFDEALRIARDNLWKISNEDWPQILPGLHVAPWKDFHAASRLFLHDLIWQLPVKGNHVAMIPNRNILLVTGDQNTAALLKMAEIVSQAATEPRFVTGSAFRLNQSTWEHFLPEKNSPAYAPLRMHHIKSVGQMYAEQKQILEAQFEKAGNQNPPFVATFSGMNSPAGELITFASWAHGVETLLPDTEKIAFSIKENGEFKALDFADAPAVHAQLADLLERTDHYPPRWLTKGFPSKERLAALKLTQP